LACIWLTAAARVGAVLGAARAIQALNMIENAIRITQMVRILPPAGFFSIRLSPDIE